MLMLFNLFINLIKYWRGGGGLGGNSIVLVNIEITASIHPLGNTLYRTLVC